MDHKPKKKKTSGKTRVYMKWNSNSTDGKKLNELIENNEISVDDQAKDVIAAHPKFHKYSCASIRGALKRKRDAMGVNVRNTGTSTH